MKLKDIFFIMLIAMLSINTLHASALPRIWRLCVDKNTDILLSNGKSVKIYNLNQGDKIINSNNEEVVVLYQVIGPETKNMYEITTETKKTVKVTTGHIFLNSEGYYLKAQELLTGMSIVTIDGNEKITAIREYTPEPSTNVYNLVISSQESYNLADRSRKLNVNNKTLSWWELEMRKDPFLGLTSNQQNFYTNGIVSGSGVIQGSINH